MRRVICAVALCGLLACDDGGERAETTAGQDAGGATGDAGPGAARDGSASAGDSGSSPADASPAGADADIPDAAPAEAPPLPAAPDGVTTADDAMALVDPFIGTGGWGFGYAAETPAAQVPNGAVRLGPDTTAGGAHPDFQHFSGYHYDDPDVRGFSHLHLVGTGAADLGNLRVMPWGDLPEAGPVGWYTSMDKESERASPGRYGVRLPDVGVEVDLTASGWSGWHRYHFDAREGPVHVAIDAGASVVDDGIEAATVTVEDGLVEGSLTFRGGLTGRQRGFTLHFSIEADPPPADGFVWAGGVFDPEGVEADDPASGAVLAYDGADGPTVELRVGVSYIDLENARAHRTAGASFEDVLAAAEDAWRSVLGRLRVAGGSEVDRRKLFTAQYHTYAMPTRLDELDGRYRGHDGEVHATDGHGYYTDLSLWDTFRTLHPWLALTDAEVTRGCLRSLMLMAEQGGVMPRWPALLGDSGSMIGSSADYLFAEGALKGIEGVDYDHAMDLLLASSAPGGKRRAAAEYNALGWVPSDMHGGSVSKHLEYAWADYALYTLARHLGRPEAEMLEARMGHLWNLLNPDTGFFAPRMADGTFEDIVPTRIFMGSGPYVEGSAWHWRWYGLHLPGVFAERMGGPDALFEQLEQFFADSALGRDAPIATLSPDRYYWHGNEPALHTAYLFHAADRPDRLWHWVRQIQNRLYTDRPDGLPGNDDGGTLSAWFLFSALGFYPVAGGDQYLAGTPLFPYVELDLPSGDLLVVHAPGASSEVGGQAAAWLNGAPLGAGFPHAKLEGGAVLHFQMSP